MRHRIFMGELLHALRRPGLAELQPGQTVACPQEVRVVVDDAGHGHAAMQIDHTRSRALIFGYIGVSAQGENLALTNGDGFGPGCCRVGGKDVTVRKDGFGRWNRGFRPASNQTHHTQA